MKQISVEIITWKTFPFVNEIWTFCEIKLLLYDFQCHRLGSKGTQGFKHRPSECKANSSNHHYKAEFNLQTEKRKDGSVPQKCHLSAHIISCSLQQQTISLFLPYDDSYPHWWLRLYSVGYCSTTGSLAGLSTTSTVPSSLRYGLPGKSPFTSACVSGDGMLEGSTIWGSGSVTSSSISLLYAVPPAAAVQCLSTNHWTRLPPQFGFVPEQQHQFPEIRC